MAGNVVLLQGRNKARRRYFFGDLSSDEGSGEKVKVEVGQTHQGGLRTTKGLVRSLLGGVHPAFGRGRGGDLARKYSNLSISRSKRTFWAIFFFPGSL